MSLSFSQLCSWSLLLLVSNLLLWQNVASVPLNSNETDDDELFLKELFDHAMTLTQNISDHNIELRRIFTISELSAKLFDKFLNSSFAFYDQFMFEFLGDQELLNKSLICCHNYSIKTPENMDEAQTIPLEDFPKMLLSRTWTWNNTLTNLLKILGSMPGTYDDVISLVEDIETENAELLEATKSILSSINATRGDVDYALWSGFEDFQSSDELSQFVALCKLSYCLHVDTHTVDLYLKFLRCIVLVDSDICSSSRNEADP
ncbi:prolactin-7A1-like [Acomys russatus]|uniref:prolactin-7A1-like n=1 Tax=Acomys russatus TaxID=60746 RepID=UPI0021E2B13F|nr:prolactin-7A1-like [Acomys russatus]